MPRELGWTEHAIAGFYSGCITRALCQPLDVVKIRFQLQEEPITSGGGKYHGLAQATRLIASEEGTRALWKGHVPAQILSVIYGAVQFSAYEAVAKHLTPPERADPTSTVNFVAGTVGGAAAVTAAHPLDVLRTRLIAQSEKHKIYHSMRQATFCMLRDEGILAFYKGWLPALAYVAPFTGINFVMYKFFNLAWKKILPPAEHKFSGRAQVRHFVCGTVSGGLAKIVTYPFDIIKKRLMVMGFEKARSDFGTVSSYSGSLDCMRQVWAHEGLAGFYKGLVPSVVKAGVSSGLAFLFYEQACHILREYF